MSFVEMSFSATVLILIIMLLRKFLLDRLPKRAFLILWGIALLRLLVPVSVPSSFSIYSLIQRWDDGRENMTGSSRTISSEWNTELLSGTAAVQNHSGMQMAKIQETESGQMERSGHKSFAVSPKILLRCCWAFGMSVLAVFFLISYTGCCRKFRRSFPVKNEFMEKWLASHMLLRPIAIRTSEAADTPLTYGILHPVILMPEETDWKDEGELYQVLEHEFVYIKRMDSLAKLIMTAAVCVHWFNPAVWRMYLLYNRDLELSCDEAVLRKIGKERRGDYARTLIRMEERRAVPAPLFSAFGRNASNQMEERITSIMKTRKHSVITMVLTAFLVGAALLVFATSARAGTVPSPESGAESKPAADPAKGEAETQSAAKPGEADWMKEFTDEETHYGDKKEPRQWPMGTRGDYDSLLALMTQDGSPCGEMPLADFNRSLLDWANEDYERMERIGEDTVMSDYQVSLDEDERRFVELTMRLSAGENAQLVRSHYKGTQPEDPWWGGRSLYKTAFDGAAFCTLYYQFPYHIPDDGRITVSERDERMEKMEQGILELFQSLEFEELLTLEKEDMVKRLEALAEELSDEKLAIAIDEDQIGFEHTGQEEYDILMNDRDTSGITVDAAFLSYDGTNNMYLQEMITNRTQKTICRVEYCMLAYEEDGSPLKIRWNFMDSSAPESYEYVIWNGGEILPGDTRSFPGGWSVYDSVSTYGLEPPEEEYTVGYVLIGIRQVEFEDGSTWMDPEYEGWLAEHKGKKMDPENLKNYYPIEREIP